MNYKHNITFYHFFSLQIVVIQQKVLRFQIVGIMYWQYILAEKRNSVYFKLLYKKKNVKEMQKYYYIRAL